MALSDAIQILQLEESNKTLSEQHVQDCAEIGILRARLSRNMVCYRIAVATAAALTIERDQLKEKIADMQETVDLANGDL